MRPLDRRVVALTGASSGIGAAAARTLAALGASVVLGGRRVDRLHAVADGIRQAGGDAVPIRLDVRDPSSAQAFVESTIRRHGCIDGLVNSAGVEIVGLAATADPDLWREMVEVNLLGALYCTRAALPSMMARRQGDVVNVSSVAGRVPSFGGAAYSATKFGLNGFSEALRQEVSGANIRVIVVEPGFADTELHAGTPDPTARAALERIRERIGAVLQPEDVAASIGFALSQPAHVSLNEILIRPTSQRV